MNNLLPKVRKECAEDSFYTRCARNDALHDHTCQRNPVTGKMIEWDHAIIFGARQVQLKNAIVPACWWAHEGPRKNRHIQAWIALNRMTRDEICDISKAVDWFRIRANLNQKYGVYRHDSSEQSYINILYPWLNVD